MQAIDRAALDAQTGGDADLAREVLDAVRRAVPVDPAPARPILPAAPDQRADLAHTLKGSAAGVGAARVRALADAAEARLRRGDGPVPLDDLDAAVAAALPRSGPRGPDAPSGRDARAMRRSIRDRRQPPRLHSAVSAAKQARRPSD